MMIQLIIFESHSDGNEIAINPQHVESVEDQGRYAEISMTSGRKHLVKQAETRSVRDWLTSATRDLRKLASEPPPLCMHDLKPGGTD